jgi:hypothetical protein
MGVSRNTSVHCWPITGEAADLVDMVLISFEKKKDAKAI